METAILILTFMLLVAASGMVGAYLWMIDENAMGSTARRVRRSPRTRMNGTAERDAQRNMPIAA